MSTNFDDLRKQAEASKPESWRPEKPGDEIAGVVVRLDSARDLNGVEHGIVVLDTGEETLRSVWLLHEALRSQILRLAPRVGDRLLIVYRGKVTSKTTGRSYVDYAVESDRHVSSWWDRRPAPVVVAAPGDYVFEDDRPLPPEPPDEPPF